MNYAHINDRIEQEIKRFLDTVPNFLVDEHRTDDYIVFLLFIIRYAAEKFKITLDKDETFLSEHLSFMGEKLNDENGYFYPEFAKLLNKYISSPNNTDEKSFEELMHLFINVLEDEDEEEVNNEPEGLIKITALWQLQLIGRIDAYPLDGTYWLMNDIDASPTIEWNDGAGFVPISMPTNLEESPENFPFMGIFDGRGHKISNIYIDRTGYTAEHSFPAFFSYNQGIIRNLKISGTFKSRFNSSSFCSINFGTGYIENCSIENGIVIQDDPVETGLSSGFILINYGFIKNCYFIGEVSGNFAVSGFASQNNNSENSSSLIENCYCSSSLSIIEYPEIIETGMDSFVFFNEGDIINCYYDSDVSGVHVIFEETATPKTTPEMYSQETFENWDFDYTWIIDENVSYPEIREPSIEAISITTIEELQKIGNEPGYPLSGIYKLVSNINASETADWNYGEGFNPIGIENVTSFSQVFSGVFDGQNYSISNLTINRPDETLIGITRINRGTIRNLKIKQASIIGKNTVGGISGYGMGFFKNCHVVNTEINSVDNDEFHPYGYLGGICGISGGLWSNLIEYCYFSGILTSLFGHSIGGICGYNVVGIEESNTKVIIRYSRTVVTIIGPSCIGLERTTSSCGGIVGVNGGEIYECYSKGNINGCSKLGGFVGDNFSGTIRNCYSNCNVTGYSIVGGFCGITDIDDQTLIENCYSTGLVIGNEYTGGFLGHVSEASNEIETCYYNSERSLQNDNDGRGIPKTKKEMIKLSTYIDWDFEEVWSINDGLDYPKLNNMVELIASEEYETYLTQLSFLKFIQWAINYVVHQKRQFQISPLGREYLFDNENNPIYLCDPIVRDVFYSDYGN